MKKSISNKLRKRKLLKDQEKLAKELAEIQAKENAEKQAIELKEKEWKQKQSKFKFRCDQYAVNKPASHRFLVAIGHIIEWKLNLAQIRNRFKECELQCFLDWLDETFKDTEIKPPKRE